MVGLGTTLALVPKPSSKREPWFRAAVAVTDRLNIGGEGRYLCPICLRWFADWRDLTREHAPPQSIGGHRVALTCKSCNSTSGATIDHQLQAAEMLRDFGQQRMTTAISAKFSIGGVATNVNMRFGPDGLQIAGIPKKNDPKATAAQTAVFERLVDEGNWEGVTMNLTIRNPDFQLAAVGWLRAAYLLAFAALGYGYILRPQLDIVRRQIQEPKIKHLDRFAVMGTLDKPEAMILLVTRPQSLESVIVFARDTIVFLPGLHRGVSIYQRLARRRRWPPRLTTINAEIVPIPNGPGRGIMDTQRS
jgi:hypothetical protein